MSWKKSGRSDTPPFGRALGQAASSGRKAQRKVTSAIQTFSGRRIDPMAADPSQIVIIDIAQALGNQCRFGGHCRQFYSVAQHSSLLCDLVADDGAPPADQLWALLHDAAEAYLVDLPHPLKHHSKLGIQFRAVEDPLQALICQRFGLPAHPPPGLKVVDRALLATEKAFLVAPGAMWPELEGVVAADVAIDPWLPQRAAAEFLSRYDRLARLLGG